jgi:hypothetical protein
MKKLLLILLFIPALCAQQTRIQPDCTLGSVVLNGAALTSGNFDNRPNSVNTGPPCTFWSLSYSAQPTVTSTTTIQIREAPDNNGSPGPFTSIAAASTLPSANVNFSTGTDYYPWIQVHLSAYSGSGNIAATLNGYRNNPGSGSGGGGGGGCTAPCVVIGPDAPGATPTQSPVQAAGVDGNGKILPLQACTLSATFSASTSGLMQVIAASGSAVIRICHWDATITDPSATPTSLQLEYGTGTDCGTNTAQLSGVMSNILSLAMDYGPEASLLTPASQAICLKLGGSIAYTGTLVYAQY